MASEEIFGPGLNVMIPPSRNTPEEAIARANSITYGLSAGAWTDNVLFKQVNKLRVDGVGANTYTKLNPTSPFGDYKESGFGREGGLPVGLKDLIAQRMLA